MAGNVSMAGFDFIIGQQLPIRLLQTFIRKDTVPHALLFTGIQGIGKRTTAKTFAMALNCIATGGDPRRKTSDHSIPKPCGKCRVCKQINSDSHPDIFLIEPQGAYLRIDQIRKLLGILAMKPFNASRRVIVIANSQAMNTEAGNALLKVLEEPPPETIIILTATQKSDLLPTIVSRCRHIHFNPLSGSHVTDLLSKTHEVEPADAQIIAELAQGSIAKARQLVEDRWREQRDRLLQAAGFDRAENMEHRSIALALSFSNWLAGEKDKINYRLDVLKTWIRDLSVVAYKSQCVVNRDCKDQLRHIRSQLNENRLLKLWEVLEKTQKDIAANANLRLTLDVMALKMIGRDCSRKAVNHPTVA